MIAGKAKKCTALKRELNFQRFRWSNIDQKLIQKPIKNESRSRCLKELSKSFQNPCKILPKSSQNPSQIEPKWLQKRCPNRWWKSRGAGLCSTPSWRPLRKAFQPPGPGIQGPRNQGSRDQGPGTATRDQGPGDLSRDHTHPCAKRGGGYMYGTIWNQAIQKQDKNESRKI